MGRREIWRGRFYALLVLTVLTLSYVFVPWVAATLLNGPGFTGNFYEPKDFERQSYLASRTIQMGPLGGVEILKVVLVVLVGSSWLTYIATVPR
jgi:hypothetical protein